jgi:cytochrome c553
MERNRMIALMKEFREGKRPATIMHQLAKGYSDQQVEMLADWFAAQKP